MIRDLGPNEAAHECSQLELALAYLVKDVGGIIRLSAEDMEMAKGLDLHRTYDPTTGETTFRAG